LTNKHKIARIDLNGRFFACSVRQSPHEGHNGPLLDFSAQIVRMAKIAEKQRETPF